ncbi:MAG: hypothetical protein ABI267_04805 [Ginsengibacter sp.]
MLKKTVIVLIAFTGFLLGSCGRKIIPSKTTTLIPSKENSNTIINKPSPAVEPSKTDTVATAPVETEKPAPKAEAKPEFPKVITVNDNAASKSVDGRLFYDVLGHRYWRNYKDGKYYLFDKSMYNNPDFKPTK